MSGPEDDHTKSMGDVGHYFDQVIFDVHYRRLARLAQLAAMSAELDAFGVTVDPTTGEVNVGAAKKD